MLSSPAADVSTDGSSCASTLMPDSRTACTDHLPDAAAVRVCPVFDRAVTVHTGCSSGLIVLLLGLLSCDSCNRAECK